MLFTAIKQRNDDDDDDDDDDNDNDRSEKNELLETIVS